MGGARMKRFIEGESRTQTVLFPERLDDWIEGSVLHYSLPVIVSSLQDLDFQITRSGASMTEALSGNDSERARGYFHSSVAEKYSAVFQQLGSRLPEAVSEFSDVSPVTIGDSSAEYLVAVTHD